MKNIKKILLAGVLTTAVAGGELMTTAMSYAKKGQTVSDKKAKISMQEAKDTAMKNAKSGRIVSAELSMNFRSSSRNSSRSGLVMNPSRRKVPSGISCRHFPSTPRSQPVARRIVLASLPASSISRATFRLSRRAVPSSAASRASAPRLPMIW